VLDGMRAGDLHIFTHMEYRGMVEARAHRLEQAFESAANRIAG